MNNLRDLALSFYYVGPGDQTCHQHRLYVPMSHITDSSLLAQLVV